MLVKNSLTSKKANQRRNQKIQGQKWAYKKVFFFSNDLWKEKISSMLKGSPVNLSGVEEWTNDDSGKDGGMGPVTIFMSSVIENNSEYTPWGIRVGCNCFFWRP